MYVCLRLAKKQISVSFFVQIIRQTNRNVHKITTMQQIEGC